MITIRTADPDNDAAALVEIYRPYVEKTAISFEYTTPSVEEFRERMKRTLEKYPYLVAESDGKIVGYVYVSPFVGRVAYEHSVETSIYLAPESRHQGIGKRLYGALKDVLRKMNVYNVYACIGVPEEGTSLEFLDNNSMDFHAHMGYRLVGRFHRCGYKFHTWLDMVWMEKIITDYPDNPEPVISYKKLREDTNEFFQLKYITG